jgi:hypothetical protein
LGEKSVFKFEVKSEERDLSVRAIKKERDAIPATIDL